MPAQIALNDGSAQDHLERIIGETGVTHVVYQIELHARFQQRGVRDFHAIHDIHIESWSPLGSGRLLDDPSFAGIAKKHGKSVAQTTIRWLSRAADCQ
jgi:2,5-diketo-D-gluconate reductase A